MSSLLRTVSCAATGIALFAAPSAAVAGPWSAPAPVDVAPESASQPNGPRLAGDAAGNLTAAWVGGTAATRAVYVSTKPRGGAWSPAKPVSAISPLGITDLTLSVNDEGVAIAAWKQVRSYRANALQAATRTSATGAWSAPHDIQPAAPAGSAVPSTDAYALDLLPGGAVAVWHRRFVEELHGDVQGEESKGGSLAFAGTPPWQPEPAPTVRAPQLAVDGDGTATLVDLGSDGSVLVSTRPVGGTWNTPEVIADAAGGPAKAPALAVNARGQAVVAWTRDSGDVTEIRVARRSPAGTWGAASTLAVGAGDGLVDARAAIDALGRPTVSWARFAASASEYTSSLQSSQAPAEGSFSAPTTLTTWQRPAGDGTVVPGLQFSDLSVNANGQALVTWTKGNEVQAVTRDKDEWSAAETIATTATEWTRSFDGEIGPAQDATVLVGDTARVAAVSKNLSSAPQPTGRALAVSAALVSWTGRCPAEATAYGNGRTAKVPLIPRGSTRYRCTFGGTIPQPATAKMGSSALVVVSGSGLLPLVVNAKVIGVD